MNYFSYSTLKEHLWLSRVVGPWEEKKVIQFITSSGNFCGFRQSAFFALFKDPKDKRWDLNLSQHSSSHKTILLTDDSKDESKWICPIPPEWGEMIFFSLPCRKKIHLLLCFLYDSTLNTSGTKHEHVWVSTHQRVLWHKLSVLQLNSILILSLERKGSYRGGAPSHKTALLPLQILVPNPGCHPYPGPPAGYKFKVRSTSSFRLHQLAREANGSQEKYLLNRLPISYKKTELGNSQMEEQSRARW